MIGGVMGKNTKSVEEILALYRTLNDDGKTILRIATEIIRIQMSVEILLKMLTELIQQPTEKK